MDALAKRPSKAAADQSPSKWKADTMITSIGLVLSLPFAIGLCVTWVFTLITEYQMSARLIQSPFESSWGLAAMLSVILDACFFFFAVPGAVLTIIGFVRRKSPLAWITLVVVAVSWLLTALYVVVYLVFDN